MRRSPGLTVVDRRRFRFRLRDRCDSKCPRNACGLLIFPLPVLRNRFAADRFVFIFGIGCYPSYLGAIVMNTNLPSCMGALSTCATSETSFLSLSIRRCPNSWCAISRPRNTTVTFTLSPRFRNFSSERNFVW